ncbi:hypothetical protein [Flavobacterium dankookense]|uniref:Uncharacterized protein n=1 Tax=Flavobacterium dankookense TaxID=706186 RepID=A0A4V3CSL9_9FLAO|nr:hypothetical protein [Flavobacterium dankookense]TDP61192.1 hypothetical protein BC748_0806 [Flavobacterium dankookense]
MKLYLKEFEDELDDFLTIRIAYNSKYNKYLFDNKWTIDVNETYFENKVEKIKKLLFEHLKNGLENKSFLRETKDKIRTSYNLLYDCDFTDISFLEQLDVLIRKNSNSLYNPTKEIYDYNYFVKKLYEESYKSDTFFDQNDEIINYHNFLRDIFFYSTKKQPTENEFEEQKLIYSLLIYKEYLMVLLSYIETLYFNCDRIDFSQKNAESSIIIPSKKCQVNLSKVDTAQLFRFLFKEGFITINDEDTNDESQIKKFIEENFTYQNQRTKKHEPIKNINKEFSELNWEHKELQIKFIDNLISKLAAQKEYIFHHYSDLTSKGNSLK